jgi:hypothetical protein
VVLWDDQGHRPTLKTEADWIKAGELVFDSSVLTKSQGAISTSTNTTLPFRDPKWYERTGTLITREGVVPFYRYVIREKGWSGLVSLVRHVPHASCRMAPLKGAQAASQTTVFSPTTIEINPAIENDRLWSASCLHSWLKPDPQAQLAQMTSEQLAAPHGTIHPAFWRIAQPDSPFRPDLIGVQGRRYLDRSGLQRHRGIGDMMRYAALNQGGDDMARLAISFPLRVFPMTNWTTPTQARSRATATGNSASGALRLPEAAASNHQWRHSAGVDEAAHNEEGCIRVRSKQGYTTTNSSAPVPNHPDHPPRDILQIHQACCGASAPIHTHARLAAALASTNSVAARRVVSWPLRAQRFLRDAGGLVQPRAYQRHLRPHRLERPARYQEPRCEGTRVRSGIDGGRAQGADCISENPMTQTRNYLNP